MPAVISTDSNQPPHALRENWQGYRGVPSQNSRSALSSLCILLLSLRSSLPWHYPFLPKTANQPSARATTGLIRIPAAKHTFTYLVLPAIMRDNKQKDPRAAIYCRGRIRAFR